MAYKDKPDKDKFLHKVLKEINKARKAIDLEYLNSIPKGIIQNPTYCPLNRALDGKFFIMSHRIQSDKKSELKRIAEAWDTKFVEKPWGHIHVTYWTETTDLLREFVIYFDRGLFPELEEVESPNKED
jgi:hypothetical protein